MKLFQRTFWAAAATASVLLAGAATAQAGGVKIGVLKCKVDGGLGLSVVRNRSGELRVARLELMRRVVDRSAPGAGSNRNFSFPFPVAVDAASVDAGDRAGFIEQWEGHATAQRFVAARLVESDCFQLLAQIAAAMRIGGGQILAQTTIGEADLLLCRLFKRELELLREKDDGFVMKR